MVKELFLKPGSKVLLTFTRGDEWKHAQYQQIAEVGLVNGSTYLFSSAETIKHIPIGKQILIVRDKEYVKIQDSEHPTRSICSNISIKPVDILQHLLNNQVRIVGVTSTDFELVIHKAIVQAVTDQEILVLEGHFTSRTLILDEFKYLRFQFLPVA
jgi:hypothetical protein